MDWNTNNNNGQNFQEEAGLNIRAELEKYLTHWKWFLLGIILALGAAFTYLRYATPKYSISSTILIKDEKKGGGVAELAMLEELSMLQGGGNNIDNEIEILKSRKIIGDVIKKLGLSTSFYSIGRVKEHEMYIDLPFELSFLSQDSLFYLQDTLITLELISENEFKLKNKDKVEVGTYTFDQTISSSIGDFKFKKLDPSGIQSLINIPVNIHVKSLNRVIDGYQRRINISTVNKNASVIKLTIQDPVKQKAENFLNELVSEYNKQAILDKNLVSKKTKEFIEGRLAIIGKELSTVDNQVRDYKTEQEVIDLTAEAGLFLQRGSLNNSKIIEIETQLKIAEMIQQTLEQDSEEPEILPSVLSEDPITSSSIKNYNELILARNKLKVSSGTRNPILLDLELQIGSIKKGLEQSLVNLNSKLKLTLAQLKKEEEKINNKILALPGKEKDFFDIKRQQLIMSELYSFLLKKKEETAISLASSVANAKIIDRAYGSNIPISPKKPVILLAGLILGLVIPFVILYIKDLLDNKIHNKKQLEGLIPIPILGDIPLNTSDNKIFNTATDRSGTAEAFRLARTNIDFILSGEKKKGKTIFVTSTIGGEGKTFISMNMGMALAISGKKVLLVGADLRNPKLGEYLDIPARPGLANYLSNSNLRAEDMIFNITEYENLDMMLSGVIPPNPAELLMNNRFEELFNTIGDQYDYIIVDTAPISLVTDTLLIGKHADMFVYVTRANYLDKRMLEIPKSLYNEKRLPNMAVLLNGVNINGFGYGYGYGYGYGQAQEKKAWWKPFSKN